MTGIQTELEIAASPERVWRVLTDFAHWGEWNPFIYRVAGDAKLGAPLRVYVKAGSGRVVFRTRISVAEPERELRWCGHFLSDRIVAGEHFFRLEPLGPERVKLIHVEEFTGLLAPAAWFLIRRHTTRGYASMNAALKQRAESPGDAANTRAAAG